MEVDTSGHAGFTPDCQQNPGAQMSVLKSVLKRSMEEFKDPCTENSFEKRNSEVPTSVTISETAVSLPQPTASPAHATSPAPSSQAKSNIGKYRLLRTIGKGNFAKVKLAIHMATGVEVAIKIINKTMMDETLLKRLKREISIMKLTNHPNIVKLLEIIENEGFLCLVMEYASGGEIFDYLVANGKMREKEARVKFRQLLSAIQYCHSKRIVHRDLKAENILLDHNLNVKVADFGLANTFEHEQRLTTFCGSPPYAAPELFLGIPYYGPGVDVWSLGVILFTLVLGHLPFDARDLRELRSKILGLHYSIPRGSVSPECESLLRKMLTLDAKDRPSLKTLMQDKWINLDYSPHDMLKPYKEPCKSNLDEWRVQAMQSMGFTQADLESSVVTPEFDHVYATYHLLPQPPSQLAVLCDDLVSPKPERPQQSTAVGRFTVAPSGVNLDTVGCDPPKLSAADTAPRDHHSIPVALRRAFVHMGRSLAGTNPLDGTKSPGSSSAGPPTTNSVSSTGRNSAKSVGKPSGTPRNTALTAAPVPFGSSKKPSLTVQPKRPSVVPPSQPATRAPKPVEQPQQQPRKPTPDASSSSSSSAGSCSGAEMRETASTFVRGVLNQAQDRSHTVQGTESHELQLQLQHQQADRPAKQNHKPPPPPPPANFAADAVPQQNTWSRGVLKAIGGLFAQSKSHTPRLSPAQPTAANVLSKPREVRFPWSVHTTSTKPAEDVLQVIVRALELTAGCRYAYDLQLPFLVKCSWASDRPALLTLENSCAESTNTSTSTATTTQTAGGLSGDDPLHWEMEVCQLPRLHLRGVRLKRIRGSALQFRMVADMVMKSMRL